MLKGKRKHLGDTLTIFYRGGPTFTMLHQIHQTGLPRSVYATVTTTTIPIMGSYLIYMAMPVNCESLGLLGPRSSREIGTFMGNLHHLKTATTRKGPVTVRISPWTYHCGEGFNVTETTMVCMDN